MKVDLPQNHSAKVFTQNQANSYLNELYRGWTPENDILHRIDQVLLDSSFTDSHTTIRAASPNSPKPVQAFWTRANSFLHCPSRSVSLRRNSKNQQAEVAELMLANVVKSRKRLPNYWHMLYELLSQGFVEAACKFFNKNKRIDVKGMLPTICLRLLDAECTHNLDKASVTTAVQALVEKGLPINGAINRSNQSLLQLVCQTGNELLVQWLISEQADLNHADCFEDRALDIANNNGHLHIVQLLTEAGAEIDANRKNEHDSNEGFYHSEAQVNFN